MLNVLLTRPFDPEEALSVAESLSRKHGCRFDGILLANLPTGPSNVANTLTFTLEPPGVNALIHDLIDELRLDSMSVRFTIVPVGQGPSSPKPSVYATQALPSVQGGGVSAPSGASPREGASRPKLGEAGLLRRTWGAPITLVLTAILIMAYFVPPSGLPVGAADLLAYAFYLFVLSAVLQLGAQLRYSARTRDYLKKNWGSPFIVGFMLLLIASAVELSSGSVSASSVANDWAVYAFYLLVVGVALQVASYVKYREQDNSLPSPLAAEVKSVGGEGGPESQTSVREGPSKSSWWKRPVLFGGLAYFWSLVNDRPVNADQVLGPQGQLAMELVLHVLVAAFLVLSIRSALRRVEGSSAAVPRAVYPLAALAFILSSWDDFAFPGAVFLDVLRHDYWYPATVSAHLVSVVLLFFAVRIAHSRGRA